MAGLVTEHFGAAKISMPGGFTPPEQVQSSGAPMERVPWGLARHGKALKGLLERYFG